MNPAFVPDRVGKVAMIIPLVCMPMLSVGRDKIIAGEWR